MIKFSLSSHHKRIRFFLVSILVVCVFLALVNISFSIVLNNALKDAQRLLSEAVPGFYFNVRFAYFNLLRGVSFYGVDCRRDGEPVFFSRSLDVGFDALSLKDRKIRIKNIRLHHARVNSARVSDLAVLCDKSIWKVEIPMEFFETTYFSASDIWLSDMVLADISGYFSSIKGDLLVSRGELGLKRIRVPAFPESDLFLGSPFYIPFDFMFEADLSGGDFVISRLEVSNPILKFTGHGRIGDVRKDPAVDLGIDFLNIMLDQFPAFNSENMQTRGVLDAHLKVSGLVSSPKALLNINLSSAEVNFFDALFLTKINGTAVVTRDHIFGQDFSLYFNNIPFGADFTITQGTYPHLLLRLSSRNLISMSPAFMLELEADAVGKELVGKSKTRFRYLAKDATDTLSFELGDFHLGYEDELFLNALTLKANLEVESTREDEGKVKTLSRTMEVKHPFSVLRCGKEGFVLDNIKGVCYGGTLEGQVNFKLEGEKLGIKGEGHLREVDLGDFFSSSEKPSYTFLGKLDGDLRFDTNAQDMFKGQIFVSDGVIEQNPLLNAVSNFLGVPSLKKVNFDELSIFFSGGRGEYASQVKLESPRVKGSLDGKITSYDKMDGYLITSLATDLMNESKQFKKILTYIRHDEPSVIFSFKISSYIDSPRVLWLKNEFKDKLSNLLPERNKRFLQREVNKMVEKMEPE